MTKEVSLLNYHHLRYFAAIATEGGITRASQKLGVSPSVLSTQLSELEGALGTALFLREGRRLLLTEAGRVALSYAQEIFRLGDELLASARSPEVRNRGQIRIGIRSAVPKTLVLSIIQQARRMADCQVQLLEGQWTDLLAGLQAHELDLLISNSPPNPGEGRLFAKKIKNYPVGVFGSEKFRPLVSEFPNSLEKQPLILPRAGTTVRQDVELYFRERRMEFSLTFETDDTAIQKQLAVAGMGLAVLPEKPVQSYIKSGRLFRIGRFEGIHEGIWLIAASRKIENPVASRLMQVVPSI
jgi:LysR family transcriptional activator of nhaA